jgi:4-hydroxy 2-oxovalerate aldolase
MKKIKILDCTLRDGGYYNNWEFSENLVNEYLNVISLINIEYCEIGFRSLQKSFFRGAHWYSTDNYLESLKIPKKLKIAVMINASEFYKLNDLKKNLNKIFKKKKNSVVSLVRIAAHFSELNIAIRIAKILNQLGYKIAINVMQASNLSKEDVNIIANISKKVKFEVLYFADSLGSMLPAQIFSLYQDARKTWKGALGIHAHNNMNRAVINSLEAVKNDCTWVDSTICGMGRGPGNAETEYIVQELSYLKENELISLSKLIKNYFFPLKQKYQWGNNIFYYLSGKNRIHPTHIQEMLKNNFNETEIIDALDELKKEKSKKFDSDLISSFYEKDLKYLDGSWSPINKLRNKNILILGSGIGIKNFKKEIVYFINKIKPIVISLNINENIPQKFVDYFIACHYLKITSNFKRINNLKSPIIMPKRILDKILLKKLSRATILDYGIGVIKNKFCFYKKGAILPSQLAICYALALATSGSVKNIFLAGFDGYDNQQNKNDIINKIFYLYNNNNRSAKVFSITPTVYNIPSKSVYSIY